MFKEIKNIPELDAKGLQEFGYLVGGIVAGIFGLLLPLVFGLPFPLWPWMVCAILVVWALVVPVSLKPLYRTWMSLGLVLNRITTPVVLGIVFFLVVFPVGLTMRLLRYDPMSRRLDNRVASFRVKSHRTPKRNMENPF